MKSTFAEEGYETDQQKQLSQPPLTKAAISNDTSICYCKHHANLILA